MVFIETALFTKLFSAYLTDDQYRELQTFLVERPDAGKLIQDTGGLRKLRWASGNKGKRGGIRVIYYWQMAKDTVHLLTLYAKNETTDLTAKEKKVLKKMTERW